MSKTCIICNKVQPITQYDHNYKGIQFKTCNDCRKMRVCAKPYQTPKFNNLMNNEIRVRKMIDKMHKHNLNTDSYITLDWIKEQLIDNDFSCSKCNLELKFYGNEQNVKLCIFTNKRPHVKDNVFITCNKCSTK